MTTFQFVPATDEQIATMQKYRDAYEVLFSLISELPNSRGLSIAKTHLEDSAMWINKSITGNC